MTAQINFTSTSSGPNGWSSLSLFLECPAKAQAKRNEALRQGDIPYPIYVEEGKPVATSVGSLYGELVQRWLMGEPVATRSEFLWNGESIEKSHPLTCAEARRLYDARTKKPSYWVVDTEVPIVIPESIFGLEITGNIDLVTKRPEGIWIGDLKTESRMEKTLKDKFSLRQQLWLYALGYELVTGVKPVGCFIDLCVKNQEPKFDIFDYEGVTDKRFEGLRTAVERVKAAMAKPEPFPSVGNCLAYSRPCSYLLAGQCSLL